MDTFEDEHFGILLKNFRVRRGLNQQGLANRIQKSKDTLSGWERGLYSPHERAVILLIARALDLTDIETDQLLFAAEKPLLEEKERKSLKHSQSTLDRELSKMAIPTVFSPIWTVPYRRNPYFTGRAMLLEQLHRMFSEKQETTITQSRAISGLGGIGKTQIALEYAYRHYDDYKAVFWVRADSREMMFSDFMSIASVLHLLETEIQEQARIVATVKQWFHEHASWLLILDNVDNLAILHEFMPTLGKGSILITSRMLSLGAIVHHPLEVEVMELEEGMQLLLHRAGLSLDDASEVDRAVASKIVEEMGGLPLALDQAGAYIEETGCSLSHYLYLYKRHRGDLLKRRSASSEYPQSVATAWSLSFQKVEKANPVAAEILRFYAFLYPDAIPEDIFAEGKNHLGSVLGVVANDPLSLDEAIDVLRRYSLVKRNPELKMLIIHRLVQEAIKDTMDIEQQRQWTQRVVGVINHVFSVADLKSPEAWPRCQQYLSHAQISIVLIEGYQLITSEAAHLLYRTAQYLFHRGRYVEMEPFSLQALAIQEQLLGRDHLDIASNLDILAETYHQQGRYAEAEPLRQRALALREKFLELEHPDIATSLYNLGRVYFRQGNNTEAEHFHQRALTIREHVLAPEHPDIMNSLEVLGVLYQSQQKYVEAEHLYKRILEIKENTLELGHQSLGVSLLNLGSLYLKQEKYEEAEPLLQRTLSIYERTVGSEHPYTALAFYRLGQLCVHQGRYNEAEQFYLRTIAIQEKSLGPEHIHMAFTLEGLSTLYERQGKYTKARPFLERSFMIFKKLFGSEHDDTHEIEVRYTMLLQKIPQNGVQ